MDFSDLFDDGDLFSFDNSVLPDIALTPRCDESEPDTVIPGLLSPVQEETRIEPNEPVVPKPRRTNLRRFLLARPRLIPAAHVTPAIYQALAKRPTLRLVPAAKAAAPPLGVVSKPLKTFNPPEPAPRVQQVEPTPALKHQLRVRTDHQARAIAAEARLEEAREIGFKLYLESKAAGEARDKAFERARKDAESAAYWRGKFNEAIKKQAQATKKVNQDLKERARAAYEARQKKKQAALALATTEP